MKLFLIPLAIFPYRASNAKRACETPFLRSQVLIVMRNQRQNLANVWKWLKNLRATSPTLNKATVYLLVQDQYSAIFYFGGF